ncbi:VWA domain-containing protein [Henriciella sp.]|uniref:vWA domain-containing protein n=1 Tax=Henriciella sp. TaxID=1968823 RepID=UPI00262CA56E|nr:VWA domain-containing protein [Henriciella sp.]
MISMVRLVSAGIVLGLLVAVWAGALAQTDLDFSKLRGASEVPPIESRSLVFEDGVAATTFPAEGSMIFSFEVDDPLTAYRITASSPEQTSIVLEAMSLELNDRNQATAREVLLTTATTSLDTDKAELRTTLFEPGLVYLGVAVMTPVEVNLKIEAVEALETPDSLPSRASEARETGNDVAALNAGATSCVRPTALAGKVVDLTLLRPPKTGGELTIYDDRGRRLVQRRGQHELKVRGLRHEDARICVETSGAKAGNSGWRLLTEPSTDTWSATEPDDAHDKTTPSRVDLTESVRAPLDTGDIDHFLISDSAEGGAFNARIRSSVNMEVCVTEERSSECYRGNVIDIGPFAKTARLSVENQRPQAGVYEISLAPAEFDAAISNLEPNSSPDFHEPKSGAGVFSGTLSNDGDVDVIGFDAGLEAQMWRIVVLGEAVDRLNLYSKSGPVAEKRRTRPGKRMTTSDFYLDPGPAYIRLEGKTGDYKLIVKSLGPPLVTSEREPNSALPRRLTPGKAIIGTLDKGDEDQFSLFLSRETPLSVSLDVPAGGTTRVQSYKRSNLSSPDLDGVDVESGGWRKRVIFPAGEHIFSLEPREPSPAEYEFQVDYANPFVPSEAAPDDVGLALSELPVLQAFSVYRQKVAAEITVENTSPEPLTGRLDGWFVREGTKVEAPLFGIRPGKSKTISMHIDAPADLHAGPLTGFVAAIDGQGRTLGTVRVNIETSAEVAPHGRHAALPAPPSMIGGINVALSAIGAQWVSVPGADVDPETEDYEADNSAGARNFPRIIDGFLEQGQGAESHAARLTRGVEDIIAPVLDLPGENPIPVAGIGIDTRMTANTALRSFAIDVSIDGKEWREVLQAQHEAWGETRYYELSNGPEPATHVRLRALDRRPGADGVVEISGFEVIAEPGATGLSDLNIADKRLWALVRGWQNIQASGTTQIDPFWEKPLRMPGEGEVSDFGLAVTFKSQMSADVSALELLYPKEIPDDYPFASDAFVFASQRGPAGPWEEIARFDLPESPEPNQIVRFDLPEYESAKAVKVDYRLPDAAYVYAPRQIRILERPETDGYRSILGLWGPYASERIDLSTVFDAPLKAGETEHVLSVNGKAHRGLVEFEQREETWRVELPEGQNILQLSTRGEPGFSPAIEATDDEGAIIEPVEVERPAHSDETRYTFMTVPGGVIELKVSEEQRSTTFLFDQSPSVSSYIPMIRRGIVDFADSMVEGRDAVKFKSFGGDWGQEGWYTDPESLRLALSTYGGGDQSSAEASLRDAARELREQEGSRAIVVISDAETGIVPELPLALDAAQARVFVLKISSGGVTFQDPANSQPIAAAWAGQTGGEVNPVLWAEDVSIGYARASARILGPKEYFLRAKADYRPEEPGFLAVTSDDAAGRRQADDAGMLVILDASGSMLKRMEGGRRIDIAKAALSDFLSDLADDSRQVRVGLRTFGGPPGSCETELSQPVGPVEVETIIESVQEVRPQNNAKTAIGAAIDQAAEDLAALDGAKSILLVTDGEETCGGDPLASVEALREQSGQSRIDIIAFALEPDIDRGPFREWAEAGGGLFVDAATASDLSSGLNAARQVRFEVFRGKELVANGASDGGPIALAPGQYEVSFSGSDTTKNVTIKPGETASLGIAP